MLIDTHAHLVSLEDLSDKIRNAEENGVGKIVSISADLESSKNTVSIANGHTSVYAAVGVHPHNASITVDNVISELERLTQEKKVVAIGETGLDYHYMNSPRDAQIASFKSHIKLAKKLNLPLVIHIRDSHEDVYKVLSEEDISDRTGVIHCFTGNYAMAKQYLDLGFHISFTGIITFNQAGEVREAAKNIPSDRIMVETDSPYLTPVPHRGKTNEPAFVKHIAEKVAEVRGVSFEEIEEITTANAERFFSF